MCIFYEKKRKTVRHSTIEIIDDSTVHYPRLSRVSINTIKPVITDENNTHHSDMNDNSSYNMSNNNKSDSDISDTIDKENPITFGEIITRNSFDGIESYRKLNNINNFDQTKIVKTIIKETYNNRVRRITIDKFENYIPIIHKISLNKPEFIILELDYYNQNNKLPWCYNDKEKIESYYSVILN
jgi:hypothetical protein